MNCIPTDHVRRLLMTTDTVGGVWNYALELCRELSSHGLEIQLATMGAPLRPAQREEAWKLPRVSIAESGYALEWMDNPWKDIAQAAEWLWQLEQEFQPDIVHLNSYAQASVPWTAPVIVAGHSCVLSWWQATRHEAAPVEWSRYAETVRHGLHAADRIVAPTRWMANELCIHYNLSEMPTVIGNGRRSTDFPRRKKEELVLSVGRIWDDAKNIRALAEIAEDLPWRVAIAGDQRAPDGREAVFPGLVSLGYTSTAETAQWLGRAGLYVAPARYEPFGLSILEAAFAECALVLGEIPSLRELWEGAAVFVAPNDMAGLRAACLELINDSAKRAELASRARQRAENYTATKMGETYLHLYSEVVRGKKPMWSC